MVALVSEELASEGQRVDILVNNAAIDPKVEDGLGVTETSRLENFSLEEWEKQLAVGLTGAFLCSQVFGSAMAQDGLGGMLAHMGITLYYSGPYTTLPNDDFPRWGNSLVH